MIKNSDGTVKFQYVKELTHPQTEEELKEEVKPFLKMNETKLMEHRKKVGEQKQKVKKVELSVQRSEIQPVPLTDSQIREARHRLDSLDKHDQTRLKTMERRNYLETYLYDKNEWLDSKEAKKVNIL